MKQKFFKSERGQNLVIYAVITIVLLALAGLVVDGGFGLVNRRQAQNAADAGALAGANMLCSTDPSMTPYDAAWQYTVDLNHADDAIIDPNIEEKKITVTAIITQTTFLARIFGSDVITSTATATAGCYGACSAITMPVAWACHSTIQGEPDPNCGIDYGTLEEPGPLYIIMDSNKAAEDYECISAGGSLNCDLNGDGTDDLIGGGGRSWLDLNGGSEQKSDYPDWILGTKTDRISEHMWLPGGDGTDTAIFHAAEERRQTDPIVIMPIFDDYTTACRPDDPTQSCYDQWHNALDTIKPSNAASIDYYHVSSFSLFKITCVSFGSNHPNPKKDDPPTCIGKDWLVENDIIDANTKTIEGYFIEGYVDGLEGKCDYKAGAYTIYLDH
jgi:Flp pilus assembly protein TadG